MNLVFPTDQIPPKSNISIGLKEFIKLLGNEQGFEVYDEKRIQSETNMGNAQNVAKNVLETEIATLFSDYCINTDYKKAEEQRLFLKFNENRKNQNSWREAIKRDPKKTTQLWKECAESLLNTCKRGYSPSDCEKSSNYRRCTSKLGYMQATSCITLNKVKGLYQQLKVMTDINSLIPSSDHKESIDKNIGIPNIAKGIITDVGAEDTLCSPYHLISNDTKSTSDVKETTLSANRTQTYPFISGRPKEYGYCYRTPAIVTSKNKNGNETILAFAGGEREGVKTILTVI